MACVSKMPQCQHLKMLLHKAQQAESRVAAWPAEEIYHHLCELNQEIKIFPSRRQFKKKLARENNVTFHDRKPVTVISQGTNSREGIILIHHMFQESERYLSFFIHKWPPTAPVTASVLAKAGFYYFGVDDTVQCFSCNGRINNWSPGDTAMGEHKRIYPRCKFVKGMDTRNVPARGLLDESTKQSTEGRKNLKSGKSSASQDEAGCSDENLSELLQPLNLEESEPPSEAKSYFMKEINRLLSFKIWPISSHVDRFDLAAAGFYCVNESNGTVQCFACFGRLSEWKAGDRPESEHLRLFPSCPFILGRPTGNVPLTPTEKDQAVRFFSSSSSRLSRPLQIASNLSQSERYGLQGQSSTSRGSSVNLGRTAALPEPADLTVKYAKYPNYASEQARLETYGRWPNDHSQIPANLAWAGFFATGVEELFQSDNAQYMVDMGLDETLIKTVLRKHLESDQNRYQTSEELLVAILEEEERQKAGAVSSVPAEEPASPKGRRKLGTRRRFQLAPNFAGISSDVEDLDLDHGDNREDEKEDRSDGDVGDDKSTSQGSGSGQRNLERREWLQNSTEFVRNSNDDGLLESNNERNKTENQHIDQE